jgi:hypothetical protein
MKNLLLFILPISLVAMMGSSCPSASGPTPRSICIEENDAGLPIVKDEEINRLNRVLILPNDMRNSSAAFFDFFAKGLEEKGWKVVDSKTIFKTDDPVADIQAATGIIPDIVAFYVLRNALLDRWTKLPKAPFVKILISEDLHFDHDSGPTKRFMEFGDAVFPRYPEAFTQTVHPKSILCHAFYHGATEPFLMTRSNERKPKLFLSGAISPEFYPLRDKALKIMNKRPDLIDRLVHPGYDRYLNATQLHNEYAANISLYQIALAGSAPQPAVAAPYVISKHFEIPATSTLMITDDFMEPLLKKLGFERDVHYISANPQNLESVTEYWLDPNNAEKRERIASNGRRLVMERHTMKHRIEQFNVSTARIYKSVREKGGN